MHQLIKYFLSGFLVILVVFSSIYLKTVKNKKNRFQIKNKYQLQFIRIDVIFQLKKLITEKGKTKIPSLVYDLYLSAESTKINTQTNWESMFSMFSIDITHSDFVKNCLTHFWTLVSYSCDSTLTAMPLGYWVKTAFSLSTENVIRTRWEQCACMIFY